MKKMFIDSIVAAADAALETEPAPDYSGVPEGLEPYKMAISSQGSFAYDGYNLSADYVGQEWAPRVLMELDTPGVYNTSLVLI